MSFHDLKARFIEVIRIGATEVLDVIGVANKLRYENANSFDNPRDIPDKGYVDSVAGGGVDKTIITGNQTNITTESGMGKRVSPELTDETLWTCTVVHGTNTFNIDQDMLQNGTLYGFPDPATETFTFKITYL